MILTSPSIYLTDRTTIETDWDCGMKRWWYKEEGGSGIVPVEEAAYFEHGRNTHLDLAAVASGKALSDILPEIEWPDGASYDCLEPIARRIGWVVAFHDFLWPRIADEFDPIMIEKELVLERPPLWVAFTEDLALRHKQTGKIHVKDYKTVGILGSEWVNHWPYAIQMHINIIGVGEELREPVAQGQIIGLVKGREKNGRLRHPYVWAYTDGKKWQAEWKYGWELRTIWDRDPSRSPKENIVEWVRFLGETVGLGQFPMSAPIFPNERLVAAIVDARVLREKQIVEWRKRCQTDPFLRSTIFEQRFHRCRPAFGDACPYLLACHNATVNADPLQSGEFVRRVPHHDLEVIGGRND